MPRPKLKDEDKTSLIQVAVRVSKEDAAKLDYICAASKTRRTDFFRQAIRDAFERLTGPPVDPALKVDPAPAPLNESDPRENAEAVDDFRAVDLLRAFGEVVPVDPPEELKDKERARELGTLSTALEQARKPLDDNGALLF